MSNRRWLLVVALRALGSQIPQGDHAQEPVWQEVVRDYRLYAEDILSKLAGRYPTVSDTDVEDAVLDAVVAYFNERSSGKTIRKPDAWLYVTARNKVRRLVRRERLLIYVDFDDKWLSETCDPTTPIDETMIRSYEEQRYAIATGTNRLLTPFERRCFRARLANRTYGEIASEESRSIQAVAYAIQRACVAIRRFVVGGE